MNDWPQHADGFQRGSSWEKSKWRPEITTDVQDLLPVRNTFIHYNLTPPAKFVSRNAAQMKDPLLVRSASCPAFLMTKPFSTKYPAMEAAHNRGECRPCAYFFKKQDGCRWEGNCRFCHLCPSKAFKDRKKEKIKALKERDRMVKACAAIHKFESECCDIGLPRTAATSTPLQKDTCKSKGLFADTLFTSVASGVVEDEPFTSLTSSTNMFEDAKLSIPELPWVRTHDGYYFPNGQVTTPATQADSGGELTSEETFPSTPESASEDSFLHTIHIINDMMTDVIEAPSAFPAYVSGIFEDAPFASLAANMFGDAKPSIPELPWARTHDSHYFLNWQVPAPATQADSGGELTSEESFPSTPESASEDSFLHMGSHMIIYDPYHNDMMTDVIEAPFTFPAYVNSNFGSIQ